MLYNWKSLESYFKFVISISLNKKYFLNVHIGGSHKTTSLRSIRETDKVTLDRRMNHCYIFTEPMFPQGAPSKELSMVPVLAIPTQCMISLMGNIYFRILTEIFIFLEVYYSIRLFLPSSYFPIFIFFRSASWSKDSLCLLQLPSLYSSQMFASINFLYLSIHFSLDPNKYR